MQAFRSFESPTRCGADRRRTGTPSISPAWEEVGQAKQWEFADLFSHPRYEVWLRWVRKVETADESGF